MVRETRHLWVGNLPDNIREDRIREHFKRYGRVQSVKLLPRGGGGAKEETSSEGTVACTVAFMDIKSASKAHNTEHKVDDRTLTTEYYEPAAIPSSATSSPLQTITPSPYSTTSPNTRFPNGHGTPEEHATAASAFGDRLFYDRPNSRLSSDAEFVRRSASSTYHDTTNRGRNRDRGFHRNGPTSYNAIIDRSHRNSTVALGSTTTAATNNSSWTYDGGGGGGGSGANSAGASGGGSASGCGSTTSAVVGGTIAAAATTTSSSSGSRYNNSQNDTGYVAAATPTVAAAASATAGDVVERRVSERGSSDQSSTKKKTKSRSGSGSPSPSGSTSSRSPSRSRSRSSSSSSSSTSSRASSSTVGGSLKSRRLANNHDDAASATDHRSSRPLAICVKNLPIRSSDTSLKDGLYHEYKKHGKVVSVKIVGQNSERHAIVCFKKPEDVEKALEVSYDKLFFGCKIEVHAYRGYDVEDNDLRPYEAEIDEYHPKATRTLFIGNLEKDVTASDLRKHFDQFGEIIEIDIKNQGNVSLYAFCQYTDIASVVKAIRKMDGEHLGNNRIKLGFGKSMPTNCVWIDGILENVVNDKYLRAQFEPFGPIGKINLARERGQALIFYEQIVGAQSAVAKMRGYALKGQKIQVDFASRECQQSFYEHLESHGGVTVVGGATAIERSSSGTFDETRRDSRFSRYDTPTRPRTSSYSSRSSVAGGQATSAIPSPGTPGSVTPRGSRSSRPVRYTDYYDNGGEIVVTDRHFRSYDEYSQGSGGGGASQHDDIIYDSDYPIAIGRDSPLVVDSIVLPLGALDHVVTVAGSYGPPPPDIRNLQKERVHLLEQLEDCPSSGDERRSPKNKRLKLDLLESSLSGASDVIIEANRDHRKVMEVRRLSDVSLKHHSSSSSRRLSIDSGKHSTHDRTAYVPHTVCKRRKTGGSDSSSRVHHYDHSGSESVGGSRPGTPLVDERPENFQPSEPRRVPREREGPLTLPLPRFAIQWMHSKASVSVAGIKGQKDVLLSSPPPAVTSPRISHNNNSSSSAVATNKPPSPLHHVQPPASPPPRPPSLISSNSSDSDVPPSPSLDERIKSLDEKYEKWSGSRALSAAGGDALAKLDATRDKFRFRTKLLDFNLKEVQPSEIVKSVLAKRSVFDEDLKRLENVGEKYDGIKEPVAGVFSAVRNAQSAGTSSQSTPLSQMQSPTPGVVVAVVPSATTAVSTVTTISSVVQPISKTATATPVVVVATSPAGSIPKTPTMLSPRSLPATGTSIIPAKGLQYPFPSHTPVHTSATSLPSPGALAIAPVPTSPAVQQQPLSLCSPILTSPTPQTVAPPAAAATTPRSSNHGENRLKSCSSASSNSSSDILTRTSTNNNNNNASKVNVNRSVIINLANPVVAHSTQLTVKTNEKCCNTSVNNNIPLLPSEYSTGNGSISTVTNTESTCTPKSSKGAKCSDKIANRRDSTSSTSSPRGDVKHRRNSDVGTQHRKEEHQKHSEPNQDATSQSLERSKSEERRREKVKVEQKDEEIESEKEKAKLEKERIEREKKEEERQQQERKAKEEEKRQQERKEKEEKERRQKEEEKRQKEEERRLKEEERRQKEEEKRQIERREKEEEKRQIEKREKEEERRQREEEKRQLERRKEEEEKRQTERREKEEEKRQIERREKEEEKRQIERREKDEEKRQLERREKEEENKQVERREKEEEKRQIERREKEEEKRQIERREKEEEKRQLERREKEEERRQIEKREKEEEKRQLERREKEEREKKLREQLDRERKESDQQKSSREQKDKEEGEEKDRPDKEKKRDREEEKKHRDDNHPHHDKRKDEISDAKPHKENNIHDYKNTKDTHKEDECHKQDQEKRKEGSARENKENNIHDKQRSSSTVLNKEKVETRHLSIDLEKIKIHTASSIDPTKRKERNNSLPPSLGTKRRMSSHDIHENFDELKKIKLSQTDYHKKLNERRDSNSSFRSSTTTSDEKSKHKIKNNCKSHSDEKKSDDKRKDKDRGERDKSKQRLEKVKNKSKSKDKDGKESTMGTTSTSAPSSLELSDKDFMAKLELRSNEDIERHRRREKEKQRKLLESYDTEEEKAKREKQSERKSSKDESSLSKESLSKAEERGSSSSTSSSGKCQKKDRIRKLTQNSSDNTDSDEPKKHSIFDIVDDEPAYISMYDKVKARSCKNMQKQEEEKRQEKIKAKFSQLKQSRAKREEKKRSTSWDEDSDSDREGDRDGDTDRHSEKGERTSRRSNKMLIASSDDEYSETPLLKSVKKEIFTDSDSEKKHNIKLELETTDDDKPTIKKTDTSDDEFKNIQQQIKNDLYSDLESDDKLFKVKLEFPLKTIKKERKSASKHQESLEELSSQIFGDSNSLPDKLPIRHTYGDNSSADENVEKKERKKHKKKQKRQKHSVSSEDSTKLESLDSNNEQIEKSKHHEKKRQHSKKDKKRDKSKDRDKSKKSKRSKSVSKNNELKRDGKMENIFGSLSDSSETGHHHIKEEIVDTFQERFTDVSNIQIPNYSDSENEKSVFKTVEEKEKETLKEEHRKRKEKRRREKERHKLQQQQQQQQKEHNEESVTEQQSNDNSMDFADMGKQLEANIKDDSNDQTKLEENITTKSEDLFSYSENDYQEFRKDGREKKKKRKKSKEEKQKHHHHHHHHDKSKSKKDSSSSSSTVVQEESLERKEVQERSQERKELERKEFQERKELERKELHDKKESERKEVERKEVERKEFERKELERKESERKELQERKEVHERKELETKETKPIKESSKEITVQNTSQSLPNLMDIPSPPQIKVQPVAVPDYEKTPVINREQRDKFLPGFGPNIDETIHESAVKSISDLDPTVADVSSPLDEDKLIIKPPEERAEEKPRVVISQEETEDAVAALLEESFGNRFEEETYQDDECNNTNVDDDNTSTLADEANVQDDEEMRQAVQSLGATDLDDVKPDTPLSEHELQIDTDTEDQEEITLRFDQPPKTPDMSELLHPPKTPDIPSYLRNQDSQSKTTAITLKASVSIGSPPSLTPIKPPALIMTNVKRNLDLEGPKVMPLGNPAKPSVISKTWSGNLDCETKPNEEVTKASKPPMSLPDKLCYPPLTALSSKSNIPEEPKRIPVPASVLQVLTSTPPSLHTLPARSPVVQSQKSPLPYDIAKSSNAPPLSMSRLPITPVIVSKPLQPTTINLQQPKVAQTSTALESSKVVCPDRSKIIIQNPSPFGVASKLNHLSNTSQAKIISPSLVPPSLVVSTKPIVPSSGFNFMGTLTQPSLVMSTNPIRTLVSESTTSGIPASVISQKSVESNVNLLKPPSLIMSSSSVPIQAVTNIVSAPPKLFNLQEAPPLVALSSNVKLDELEKQTKDEKLVEVKKESNTPPASQVLLINHPVKIVESLKEIKPIEKADIPKQLSAIERVTEELNLSLKKEEEPSESDLKNSLIIKPLKDKDSLADLSDSKDEKLGPFADDHDELNQKTIMLNKEDSADIKEDTDYWSKEVNLDSVIKTLCSADESSNHSADNEVKDEISKPQIKEKDDNILENKVKDEKDESLLNRSEEKEFTEEDSKGSDIENNDKDISEPHLRGGRRGGRGRGRKLRSGTTPDRSSGIQTRRSKILSKDTSLTPAKRGGRGGAKQRSDRKSSKSGDAPTDVYEFRDDSDESNANKDRPRLILTIKSSAANNAGNAQSTATITQKEVPKKEEIVHKDIVLNPSSPIKPAVETKEEFLSPTSSASGVNTRKSRRLQERDRSTIDDTIEDVIRNTVMVTRSGVNQNTPRRSGRQTANKNLRSPEVSKKPARNVGKKAGRRASETDEAITPEKSRSLDEIPSEQKPVEVTKEDKNLVVQSQQPKEKPFVGLKAAVLNRLKSEFTQQGQLEHTTLIDPVTGVLTPLSKDSEEGSKTTLIDPVTGLLTPMRECEEGKYIPLPGEKKAGQHLKVKDIKTAAVKPQIQQSVITTPSVSQPKPQTLKAHVLSSQATQQQVIVAQTAATVPKQKTVVTSVSLPQQPQQPTIVTKACTPINQHLNVNVSVQNMVPAHLSPRLTVPPTLPATVKPPQTSPQIVSAMMNHPLKQQQQILPQQRSVPQNIMMGNKGGVVVTSAQQHHMIMTKAQQHHQQQQLANLKQVMAGGKGHLGKAGVLSHSQIMTASPPLGRNATQPMIAGGRVLQQQQPGKGAMEPPKIDVSISNMLNVRASLANLSPQGQAQIRHIGQSGMPVPTYEASLGETIPHFPPGSVALRPPHDLPPAHYIHPSHVMYQPYLRQAPYHLPRSPMVPSNIEKSNDGQEGEEAPVTSPPLELRRPGSVGMPMSGRGPAVPHSLHSPHERATDSPQVGQVYNMHSARMRHYPTGRYYDHSGEPPPAHRPLPSHASLSHITALGTPDPPLSSHLQPTTDRPLLGSHPTVLGTPDRSSSLSSLSSLSSTGPDRPTDRPLSGHLTPDRPISSMTSSMTMGVGLGAAGNFMGAVARHVGADAPTSQRGLQAATPPHASQVPPQAESLFMLLKYYPLMWQGLLALKNDQAAVQMYFVSGNDGVAKCSLPKNTDGSTPPLRIFQRMRLEPPQVEGVARKMQMENEHCMLLALPCGHDHMDVLKQSTNLTNGFITYLQQKQAAGIVNVAAPGTTQPPAYVVHIFPSCDFVNENLRRIAPNLLERVADIAHLLIVITTV